jgi:hypothetical protein
MRSRTVCLARSIALWSSSGWAVSWSTPSSCCRVFPTPHKRGLLPAADGFSMLALAGLIRIEVSADHARRCLEFVDPLPYVAGSRGVPVFGAGQDLPDPSQAFALPRAAYFWRRFKHRSQGRQDTFDLALVEPGGRQVDADQEFVG